MKARRWLWALGLVVLMATGWVLCASCVGGRVSGCPEACATSTERQDGPLRLLSLNMLHGFPRFERLSERIELIAAEIRRLDPDIVCLQEVPWTLRRGGAVEALAARSGLNHVYVRANGNRWAILFEEGEAILSRYPLRDAGSAELLPRAGFFEHRVALRATALTPWGDVRVFVAHLTNGDAQINAEQAAALQRFVQASGDGGYGGYRLAVIAGDFNAREDSPQIQALAAAWTDTYRAVHPADPGYTCCIDDFAQGPEESLEKRIDYLFLAQGEEPAASVVDSRPVFDEPFPIAGGWQWASDHVGLLAEIDMD